MPIPLYLIDAFAAAPFVGNPAAVCLLDRDAPEDGAWMQRVAMEMNQSETAFVRPLGGAVFGLRWFTPAAEVELCGHATLASAHLLYELRLVAPDAAIDFHTRVRGTLRCTLSHADPEAAAEGPGQVSAIAMDFPADETHDAPAPPGLLAALRLDASAVANVARTRYDLILELHDESAVRAAAPDFAALAAFDVRGIALTALHAGSERGPASEGPGRAPEVVSRFFAPRLRIAEDPVTGSLHCALAPYYARRHRLAGTLRCEQASARGGKLDVTLNRDRVTLAGRAVTTLRGELLT